MLAWQFDSFEFRGLEIGELEEGSSEKEKFLSLRVSLMPMDAAGIPKQADPMVRSLRSSAFPRPQNLPGRVRLCVRQVFSERSQFLRQPKGNWLYGAGEVRTEAAGFKDRVLNSDKDVDEMRKDVDYVTKLIKDKTGGGEGGGFEMPKVEMPNPLKGLTNPFEKK